MLNWSTKTMGNRFAAYRNAENCTSNAVILVCGISTPPIYKLCNNQVVSKFISFYTRRYGSL